MTPEQSAVSANAYLAVCRATYLAAEDAYFSAEAHYFAARDLYREAEAAASVIARRCQSVTP